MIKKIISGGQTGADRAALDVALKLQIPHGGWIPKRRAGQESRLPAKYQLQEMSTDSCPATIEKNVMDSDATVIISHGGLTGGSAETRKAAMKIGKPWFHVNLNKLPTFQAAIVIEDWISKNGIETLNVAGPLASEDPTIYGLVTVILELVLNLTKTKNDSPATSNEVIAADKRQSEDQPETVEEAVNFLIPRLSLKDKSTIAKMSEDALNSLKFSFGGYIRNRLLYPKNDKLLESCRQEAMDKYLHWDQASAVIIKRLWERLKKSHKLRIVQ